MKKQQGFPSKIGSTHLEHRRYRLAVKKGMGMSQGNRKRQGVGPQHCQLLQLPAGHEVMYERPGGPMLWVFLQTQFLVKEHPENEISSDSM